MSSLSKSLIVGLSLLVAVAWAPAIVVADDATAMAANPGPLTANEVAFHDAMRTLWEDHITWTRLFIVDYAAGMPETDATTQRLLQNQVDIGDAIKPYYGEDAGNKLTELLKQHILTAADVLAAAKAGDTAKVDATSKTWYANGDEIATFLSTANPDNWPLAETKAMMKSHLDDTLAEVVAHLRGDWAADVAAYDTVHTQILQMADMLSAGIFAQFPDTFA